MTKTEQIKSYCTKLRLSALSANFDQLVADAEQNQLSYLDLVKNLIVYDINKKSLDKTPDF
ncbi:MAG: hypothetical protein RIA62_17630 [Cyclobacteriaceae bacterium]|tara:strand:- start:127 stop:309 length:183 start_codon:yes stop_codon:yes gene_type:complete